MEKNVQLKLSLEVVWWIITAIIVFAVMYPIHKAFVDFPFWGINILFIVIFVTYTRYIFLLKHSLIAYNFPVKLFVLFLSLPLTFYLISCLSEFQFFLDEEGQNALLMPGMLREPLSAADGVNLTNYVRKELFFFSVGSIITAIFMPFRMVKSIWRTRNRGTV